MAYTQVIERKKATRYRGFYRDADGRYWSTACETTPLTCGSATKITIYNCRNSA